MWRLEKWTRSVLPSGSHGRRRRKILIGRTEGRAARKREKPAAVAALLAVGAKKSIWLPTLSSSSSSGLALSVCDTVSVG